MQRTEFKTQDRHGSEVPILPSARRQESNTQSEETSNIGSEQMQRHKKRDFKKISMLYEEEQ